MLSNALFTGAATLIWLMSTTSCASAQAAASGPVNVKIQPAVAAKVGKPAPANATKKKSVGAGATTVNTANSADDDDSFWVEQVDVDGDGTVEDTNVVWDDEDKVLYLYADGDFTCANGKTGSGGLLIALFGEGNTGKKPAGSGWYVVSLDEGECAAKAAGLYGCAFDAKGQATACGIATLDEKHDDLVVVTATN